MKCEFCNCCRKVRVETFSGYIYVDYCTKYNDYLSKVVTYSKCGWWEQ